MSAPRIPDVIVGIDLGHDSTKVALALANGPKIYTVDWSRIDARFMALWPVNALPTAIAYSSLTGEPVLIGDTTIGELPQGDLARVIQGFKLQALSEGQQEQVVFSGPDGVVHGKAPTNVCQDYLTLLRPLIAQAYHTILADDRRNNPSAVPSWGDACVDVMLSVPSIVGPQGAQALAVAARLAGFQTYDQKHLVQDVRLTEPEAAALHVLNENGQSNLIENGNTVLVIDIGASTSDTAIQAVADKATGKLKTNFMQPVSSNKFGGSYLDKAYKALVRRRLMQHDLSSAECDYISRAVTDRLLFEHKSRLARDCPPPSGDCPTWEVPGGFSFEWRQGPIGKPFQSSDVCFDTETLVVKNAGLARLVDQQIFGDGSLASRGGIQEQVRNIVEDLVVHSPSRSAPYRKAIGCKPVDMGAVDRLDLVVFCGGFCNMPYARDRLEDAIRSIPDGTKLGGDDCNGDVGKCLAMTRYLLADDAQLCVCKGLVLARQRELLAEEAAKKSKRVLWRFKKTFLMG